MVAIHLPRDRLGTDILEALQKIDGRRINWHARFGVEVVQDTLTVLPPDENYRFVVYVALKIDPLWLRFIPLSYGHLFRGNSSFCYRIQINDCRETLRTINYCRLPLVGYELYSEYHARVLDSLSQQLLENLKLPESQSAYR